MAESARASFGDTPSREQLVVTCAHDVESVELLVESIVHGFVADLDATVCVVATDLVATDLTSGQGRDPSDVASPFHWGRDDGRHGGYQR